jgi:hypothetical protein
MNSWADVQSVIRLRNLPYTVIRFNMSLAGCLIDTASGETLADTVKDAARYLGERGSGEPGRVPDLPARARVHRAGE